MAAGQANANALFTLSVDQHGLNAFSFFILLSVNFCEAQCANREKLMFSKFLTDQRGASAVEYGLIAAVLSLAIIGGISLVMTAIQTEYTDINSDLNQAIR